ncbi:hypothetical protein BDZ94DRAFT_961444 [Collybia nuda]|uniref:Lysine-specific metallo-endopeptidase domain-containing protein n=1 Tax=Collybia nuda TaxID=64659 RepID=A0A9P6CPB9_9AGAR|nr:hypothetical protein BDZ94DRAFT_961444 [Collybia nuda]
MAAPGRALGIADSTLADTANDALRGVNGATLKEDHSNSLDSRAPHVTFVGCSILQENTLSRVAESARILSNSAYQRASTPGATASAPFTTWFGSFDVGRSNVVLGNLRRMGAATFDTWVYNCAVCTSSTPQSSGIWVPAGSSYGQVQVCPGFWRTTDVRTIQEGSMIGALVSFDNIGGAVNRTAAFNRLAAMNLARSNPNAAITNTYSYVFYGLN